MRDKIININKASWILKILCEDYSDFQLEVNCANVKIRTNIEVLNWDLGEKLVKECIKRDFNWKFNFNTGKLVIELW